MRTIILASLGVASMSGALPPQPPAGFAPAREAGLGGSLPGVDGGVYFIRRDPAYRVHEAAVEYVQREIFSRGDARAWALPVGEVEDGWLHGETDAGEAFSIELGMYVEIGAGDDGVLHAGASVLVWEGVVSTDRGSVVVWGLGAQLAGGARKVVPWLVQADQVAAFERHLWLTSVNGDGPRTMCALDERGWALMQKAHLDARDGVRKTESRVKWSGVGCLTVGIAGCLIGGPVGCLPGVACFGGAILGTLIWNDEAKSEWEHTRESICADAQWRADHPGEESPYDDLKFDTPDWAPLPISLN